MRQSTYFNGWQTSFRASNWRMQQSLVESANTTPSKTWSRPKTDTDPSHFRITSTGLQSKGKNTIPTLACTYAHEETSPFSFGFYSHLTLLSIFADSCRTGILGLLKNKDDKQKSTPVQLIPELQSPLSLMQNSTLADVGTSRSVTEGVY
jgi:hypothetical protein